MAKSTTHTALTRLFKTSTGSHILDSGGAYGRNWERNQARDLDAEPAATIYASAGDYPELQVTLDAFHWLEERVEYDPALTRAMLHGVCTLKTDLGDLNEQYKGGKFVSEPYNTRNVYVSAMDVEDWLERLNAAHSDKVASGIAYDDKPFTVNTYNGEDMLSQVLQYVYFSILDDITLPTASGKTVDVCSGEYIALQIHQGCDVRGGYTSAEVFRVYDDYSLFDNASAVLECEGSEHQREQLFDMPEEQHYWSTDDSAHWYYQGCVGLGAGAQLESYAFVSAEDTDVDGNAYTAETAARDRCVFIDEDNQPHCPLCGGRLVAYSS